MAILNTNEVILQDSKLQLSESIISAHTTQIKNDKMDSVKVRAQTGFFLNPAMMLESPTNALKIDGYKGKEIIEFDYPTDDTNVFYFFDLKLKAHLLACFPSWDESKLVITTKPVAE